MYLRPTIGFNGEVWQCVEDANIAWHCGASSYKHAECRNANSIGIEMCVRKKNTKSMGATDKDWYFEDATVEAAAELTRYLMNKYGVPASHVIRHYDVTGKICPNPYVYNTSAHTWDEFKRKISGQAETPQGGNEKTIWNFLTGKGLNAYAVAGIMGNLYAESGLMPNNLQNTYNNKLGKTDAEYTAAVDNGSYGNFVKDSAGYGLAQWTYWSRKQALLNHAKQAGVSIADLNMQLGFLWEELQGYTAVMDALKKAGSVRAASDAVLTGYEKPADQSETVKKKRAEYGEGYYKKYAAGNGTKYYRVRKSWTDAASQLGAFTSLENAKSACKAGYTVYDDNGKAVYTAAGQQTSAGVPFSVQVDILDLNIRTGAGTNYTLLVLTERKTRNEIIFKLPDHTDEAVVAALDRLERKWGADMFKRVFKTITVDNGSEFADTEGLQRSIINEGEKRTKVYYCHPYSSWERGTNEVTNKMIRRKIPKGTNFDDRTEEEVESIENWINGYPRKIHGYHSAGELFEEEVKQLA